jgi:hypothetical protein
MSNNLPLVNGVCENYLGRMTVMGERMVGGSLIMGGDVRPTKGRWRSLGVTRSLLW